MKRINVLLVLILLMFQTAFSQKHKSDSTKFKRWEFGIESGIYCHPKPKENSIYSSSSTPGGLLNLGINFKINKWLSVHSGVGFCSASYQYKSFNSAYHYDSVGAVPISILDTFHTKACFSKLYLPVKIIFGIMNKNDKHFINIGVGFQKQVILTNKFERYSFYYDLTRKYSVLSSDGKALLNSFFKKYRSVFYATLSISYIYKFPNKIKLGIGYELDTNFKKIDMHYYGLSGGTSHKCYLLLYY